MMICRATCRMRDSLNEFMMLHQLTEKLNRPQRKKLFLCKEKIQTVGGNYVTVGENFQQGFTAGNC